MRGRPSLLRDPAQHLDPATTLSAPSSQPPLGTESICPPIRSAAREPPRVNHWFPASSVSSSTPSGSSFSGEPFARANPRVRPRDALGAFLVAGELAELAQLVDCAARVKRHGGQLYKSQA